MKIKFFIFFSFFCCTLAAQSFYYTLDEVATEERIIPEDGFSPASIEGLAAWYDVSLSENYISNGSSVSRLNDLSGNNRHLLQNDSGKQPQVVKDNGKPALNFDGVDDYLSNNSPFIWNSGTQSIFIVMKAPSQNSKKVIFEGSSSNSTPLFSFEAHYNGGMKTLVRDESNVVRLDKVLEEENIFNDQVNVVSIMKGHTRLYGNINREMLGMSGITEYPEKEINLDIFSVGAKAGSSVRDYYNGQIKEIIIFDKEIGSGDALLLENYLIEKWQGTVMTTTSAGVYAEDGTLLRTLWNNELKDINSVVPSWDGLNDEGNNVEDQGHEIRMISNNITANWEGVIGNTSDQASGDGVHVGYFRFYGMAIANGFAYVCNGFNEGNPAQWKFDLNQPNTKIRLPGVENFKKGQYSTVVCTDGETVYYGGHDAFKDDEWFIFGLDTSNDEQEMFSSGEQYITHWGSYNYKSVIGQETNADGYISGLVVQRNGDHLIASHRDLNRIKVYNKNTGALVTTIDDLDNPSQIFIDTHGNGNLWINHSSGIEKFRINSDGSISSTGIKLEGNQNCLAIGGEHNGSTVSIVDGNTQQVKTFDAESGRLLSTFGQNNGYASSPLVQNDKFYFYDGNDEARKEKGLTCLVYEEDGSFWIEDSYNYRLMHFNEQKKLEEHIMFMPVTRVVSVHPEDPARIFSVYLEFEIDYNLPLSPDNGSWKLKRNWQYYSPKVGSNEYRGDGIPKLAVVQGRTYGQIRKEKDGKWEIYELVNSKGLRPTGRELGRQSREGHLYPDGSIQRSVEDDNLSGTNRKWTIEPILGLDENGNLRHGPEKTLAYIENMEPTEPYRRYSTQIGEANPMINQNNKLISWHANDNPDSGYHLGAIDLNGDTNDWLWKAAPSTSRDYSGPYPTDGTFDIGNGVTYAGGPAVVIDDYIFWQYHGEFWKQGQTNYWHIFTDEGLMLSLFGTDRSKTRDQRHPAEMAGNVLSADIVKIGEDYYIYHSDEADHGGIHRWKVSNMESIQKKVIPISQNN
ncbi:hypothetical protein RM545_06195 [Zunongwangia sp. F260]|uniref:Uncharacterized protein n=1 Tax=Autumnicola lenta TaxID=3075593 RepID=A0ABU3CIV8_9FLAO|nr:hypothetical protein [Zunongwangia sp. F260]MDT0646274.1 hypothetical protein [Zunongwangia sp. F260]